MKNSDRLGLHLKEEGEEADPCRIAEARETEVATAAPVVDEPTVKDGGSSCAPVAGQSLALPPQLGHQGVGVQAAPHQDDEDMDVETKRLLEDAVAESRGKRYSTGT